MTRAVTQGYGLLITLRNEVRVCQSFCSQGEGVSGRHHPLQTPPWADTPPGRHPSRQTPSWADTPCPVHAGIHPPPAATAADGKHRTGMHSCY